MIKLSRFEEIPLGINYQLDSLKDIQESGNKYLYIGKLKEQSNLKRWGYLALTVAKLSLSILIFPPFLPCYRKALSNCYRHFKIKEREVFLKETQLPTWKKIELTHALGKAQFKNMCSHPEDFLEREVIKIQEACSKIFKNQKGKDWFGPILFVPGEFGLWMKGVAAVVAYLIEKNPFLKNRLYVCKDNVAFTNKLSEIMKSPEEGCYSFILPTYQKLSSLSIPQHKVAIGVEKKNQQLRVFYLESQPHVNLEAAKEIMSQLKNSFPYSVDFFYSAVKRETHYGCESFAIEDSVNFLKQGNEFLNSCLYKQTSFCNEISYLPQEFMKGTQSITVLASYIKQENPNTSRQDQKKSLMASLKKYVIKTSKGKSLNYRIAWKSYKNMHRALTALSFLTPQEQDKFISNVLI